ncbi:OmpA family protein [Alteromonas facilis]|uniref:OmpA family protein n=1 Tax=Alteromonas facilis TaxID=2048004 RepID=UPI001F0C6D6C|nr:OmpA family protein [Alteromonas facilis]
MLKRTLISTAIAAGLITSAAYADEAPAYDGWFGGFVQYYNADSEKPEPNGYLDEGHGLGFELGFRFDKHWAARVEVAHQEIDFDPNKPFGVEEEGKSLGADVMYFLDDDKAYLFGGLRHQNLDQSYRMAAAGIGKHWALNDRFMLITEAMAFREFGEGFNDHAVKIGLAYTFGDVTPRKTDRDSDGDGVMDSRDQCPNTPPGQAVDTTGCNNDLDGDGVVNANDQCPNTPKGTPVNAVGCSLVNDSDNDGVPNDKDQCPDSLPNDKVDANGCVIFEEKELSIALRVLFANNSDVVTNPQDAEIKAFADFLNRYVNTSAVIEGHTSSVGSDSYNMALSERRANAVRDLLINAYGIDAGRLSAEGFGETRLLDASDSAEAHKMNRRIEAKVSATVKERVSQ